MDGGALSNSGGLLIFSSFSHLTTHIIEPWPTSARSTTTTVDFPLLITPQQPTEYVTIKLSLYYSIVSNIII